MRVFLLLVVLCLSACSKTQVGAVYSAAAPRDTPPPAGKTIFLTIDGTGNSAVSRTNAARLFEIVDATSHSAKTRPLATYYAEGVGSRDQILGLALGNGMSEDIRNAYAFLLGSYRKGDAIYLSGFSRGAYGVRALNGLIGFAGIPEAHHLSVVERNRLARDLFRAYKIRKPATEKDRNALRLTRIDRVLAQYPLRDYQRPPPFSLEVKGMAIWDTVEALGMPDRRISPIERVPQYHVEPCNVRSVYHALALDDNRAYSFTPITADGVVLNSCPRRVEGQKIEEVWFAGAHADVGGSYAPDDRIDSFLPGVSLNWLLGHLAKEGLVPHKSAVFEDRDGPIHDAKAYTAAYKMLSRHFRYPLQYQAEITGKPRAKPKVHVSALQRLLRLDLIDATLAGQGCPRGSAKPLLMCKGDFGIYGFVREMVLAECMYPSVSGYALTPAQNCIVVVCDPDADGTVAQATGYCGLEATDRDLIPLLARKSDPIG